MSAPQELPTPITTEFIAHTFDARVGTIFHTAAVDEELEQQEEIMDHMGHKYREITRVNTEHSATVKYRRFDRLLSESPEDCPKEEYVLEKTTGERTIRVLEQFYPKDDKIFSFAVCYGSETEAKYTIVYREDNLLDPETNQLFIQARTTLFKYGREITHQSLKDRLITGIESLIARDLAPLEAASEEVPHNG